MYEIVVATGSGPFFGTRTGDWSTDVGDANEFTTWEEAVLEIGDLRNLDDDRRNATYGVRVIGERYVETIFPSLHRKFTIESIDLADLGSADLRAEADPPRAFMGAYRIHIDAGPFDAEALIVPFEGEESEGRIGIAWGADADWGNVHHLWATDVDPYGYDTSHESPAHVCDGQHDIIAAINEWLNDTDAWEARQ